MGKSLTCVICRRAYSSCKPRSTFGGLCMCDCCEVKCCTKDGVTPLIDSCSQSTFKFDDTLVDDGTSQNERSTFDYVSTSTQTWAYKHNELLFFGQNQLESGTTVQDVCRYILDFYDIEQCLSAKETIVSAIESQVGYDATQCRLTQMKKRIGTSAKETTVMDIMQLLLHRSFTDIEPPVRFVAAHASNVPSVSLSSIDATSLVRQVALLKHQMQEFQSNYITRAELIEATTGLRSVDEHRSHHQPENKQVQQLHKVQQQNFPAHRNGPETWATIATYLPGSNLGRGSGQSRTILENRKEDTKDKNKDVRQVGQKGKGGKSLQRRHIQRFICGSGALDKASSIKPSARRVKSFVTRLHPSTSAEDIREFISSKFNMEVEVEMSTPKFPDFYSSFLISSLYDEQKNLMNPDIWPSGVLIKPFYPRKPKGPTSGQYDEEVGRNIPDSELSLIDGGTNNE